MRENRRRGTRSRMCCLVLAAFLAVAAVAAAREKKDTPEKTKTATTQPAKPEAATKPTTQRVRREYGKRVLFIGNSYTGANNLPFMLRTLAINAHDPDPVVVDRIVVGGSTLERHWKKGDAKGAIRKGKWDFVVLQEQSMRPILRRELMHRYARRFHDEILAARAKTVFFLTWSRRTRLRDQYHINEAYLNIARELGAKVAPVGMAWKLATQRRPEIKLYRADNSHPTTTGTYLTACVFYGILHAKSPAGLPGRLRVKSLKDGQLKTWIALEPKVATFLQEIAWEAVLDVQKRLRKKK